MPRVSSPSSRARMTAIRAESTRFIWPAPTPITWSRVVSTIALDFACFATRQAKRSASRSGAVGARRETILSAASSRSARSADCASSPPRTLRYSARRCGSAARSHGTSKTRHFFLVRRSSSSASGAYAGANRISTKMPASARTTSRSSVRLTPTIPP